MPDKSSQAAGQVFEPNRPYKPLHVLGRRLKTKALVTGLKGSDRAGHASKSRCGGESSQAGSIPVRLRVERSGSLVGTRVPPPFPCEPSTGPSNCPNVLYREAALERQALRVRELLHDPARV